MKKLSKIKKSLKIWKINNFNNDNNKIKTKNKIYNDNIEENIFKESLEKNIYKTNYNNIIENRENGIKKSKIPKKNTPLYNKNDTCNINMESCMFKQKYKIKESEAKIDLTNKKIGAKGLEIFSLIEFNKIKTLSLDDNDLYTITPLRNMNCDQLFVLNLDNNKINDLSILSKVKCNQLQKLWLNNNNITNISYFKRISL